MKIENNSGYAGWVNFMGTSSRPSSAGSGRNKDALGRYRKGSVMQNKRMRGATLVSLMVVVFWLSAVTALGQDMMRSGGHAEGYGAYGTMGQDPDEILAYGRAMMRYGFRETGMPGGFSKYPGYDGHVSEATIKKLNAEQESFIRATEALRQAIYEKELYLKAELVKKQPDIGTALGFQKAICQARGQFAQKMITHLIQMKRINLEAERK